MLDLQEINKILTNSPSVELLKWRHRDLIISFFIRTFKQEKTSLTAKNIQIS